MPLPIESQGEGVPEPGRHEAQLAAIRTAAEDVAPFTAAAVTRTIAPFQRVFFTQVLAHANVEPAVRGKRYSSDAVVRIIARCIHLKNRRAGLAHTVAVAVVQDDHAVAMSQVEL